MTSQHNLIQMCFCRLVKVKWSHSVVSDSLQPVNCSPPSSSVHGILQARILECTSNWDEILSHYLHALFWVSNLSILSFRCEFHSSSGLFFSKENKKSPLACCLQDDVPVLPGAWQDGLCLLWASCWEAGHNSRWYWSEQGFHGWTLHSGEETGYAFLMRTAPWLQPQVPTGCLPEVRLKSLREGSVKVLAVQSCLTLGDLVDCSLPGSSVYGILQARTLERVAIPFSRGTFWPRDQTHISHICCVGRWVLYR